MTTRDIETHLAGVYKVAISPELVSKITDAVLPELREWQARPLDAMYPIMYLDAIMVKVRTDGRVTNRPVYIAMAIDLDGCKHVLGLWLGTGDEGSKYWLGVLTEIHNRGVKDVLIACCDGLTGFSDAIEAVWPQATVQTCVVHLIRIDRPSGPGMRSQSWMGFRLRRRRCRLRSLITRSWRAVSLVQPRASASSRRTTMSASCSSMMSARSGSGTKLSHCSQMLA